MKRGSEWQSMVDPHGRSAIGSWNHNNQQVLEDCLNATKEELADEKWSQFAKEPPKQLEYQKPASIEACAKLEEAFEATTSKLKQVKRLCIPSKNLPNDQAKTLAMKIP